MRFKGTTPGKPRHLSLAIFFILACCVTSLARKPIASSSSRLAISSIGPNTGPAAGGTIVTVAGTGFTHSASVAFGGVAASAVIYVSSTELQARAPAHAGGTVSIAVTENPHSELATLINGFTYTEASSTSMSISGISPSQGPASGGTAVTVTGTGFQTGTTVEFGSVQSAGVTVVSSTQITAVSPPESAGTVAVTVTGSNSQSASLPSAFTYSSGPSLSSVSPTSGPVAGGTAVTIMGSGFQSGASVAFGSVGSTAVTVAGSNQITAVSPPESAGTVAVTVTNSGSQSASLPSAFKYTSGPSISSVSPQTGPVTGGTTVTILGSGFQSGASVAFGGLTAGSVKFVSSTEIQAVTPTSPAGTVSVAVANSDSQTGTLPSAFTFFHTVSLAWTGSTSSIAGYNVYRGSTSGGPYARLNSALVSGTSFNDNNVQSGNTYFYVTTAVDNNNVESGDSNQAEAIVPSP
jgi:IPT/TIG domain